jgi:hypothetical protein
MRLLQLLDDLAWRLKLRRRIEPQPGDGRGREYIGGRRREYIRQSNGVWKRNG